MMTELVAEALGIPVGRVAVRHPDTVDGVADLPEELRAPDAVTPLGILKIASINTLHFLAVWINDIEYSLFNFRELNVSDALLAAGISLRKYNGRPGMGLMLTVNGERRSFPGTMGTLAQITIDGKSASLDSPIHDDCRIKLVAGENGTQPTVHKWLQCRAQRRGDVRPCEHSHQRRCARGRPGSARRRHRCLAP